MSVHGNVIGFEQDVPVVQSHSYTRIEDALQIRKEVRVHKVAGLLKCPVDVVVGTGIVEIDSDGLLDRSLIEIVEIVPVGSWIVERMPNVVHATTAIKVVR